MKSIGLEYPDGTQPFDKNHTPVKLYDPLPHEFLCTKKARPTAQSQRKVLLQGYMVYD